MIFLPNKIEKYAAGLRNLIQKQIIKKGITENLLKNLQKLYEAEVILTEQTELPFDIKNFATELLTAVYLKKLTNNKKFDFYVNIKGNFLFDKKGFTALILRICLQANYIAIFELNKRIVIKACIKKTNKIKLLIKKLGGLMFCEKNSGIYLLVFPFFSTDKITRDFEDTYFLLQNPLSPVNFYL